MVGVREDGLRADAAHLFGSERFDGGFRADGNERRGGDIAVRGVDNAGAAQRLPGAVPHARVQARPDRKSCCHTLTFLLRCGCGAVRFTRAARWYDDAAATSARCLS